MKYLPKIARSPVRSTNSETFSAVWPAAERIRVGSSGVGSGKVISLLAKSEGVPS